MKDETIVSPKKEEVKKPPAKQPPEPKAKPSTAAAKPAASSKGPAAPQIQEEDVGAGLSKEEAEAKV